MIALKSPSELARMRWAGRIVAEVLAAPQRSIDHFEHTIAVTEGEAELLTRL
jgi:methionine aminopeptidase